MIKKITPLHKNKYFVNTENVHDVDVTGTESHEEHLSYSSGKNHSGFFTEKNTNTFSGGHFDEINHDSHFLGENGCF